MKKPKLLMTASLASTLWVFYRGLIERLICEGFDVTVAASDDCNIKRFEQICGCRVFTIMFHRHISPLRDATCIWRLVRWMRQEAFDLVHAHTPKAGLLGIVSAYLARVPQRVYTLHGLPMETSTGIKRELLRQVERITMRLATCRLVVSRSLAQRAVELKVCAERDYYILGQGSACGVDTTRFCTDVKTPERVSAARAFFNIPVEAQVIGFVGRITLDKGIEILLDAFDAILQKNKSVYLLIVGNFDKLQTRIYRRLKNRICSNKKIRYCSFIDDICVCYSAIDLLVLPSRREGFNYALLEAAACGIPTVATRVTGCVDVVVDNETGFLVDVDNTQQLELAIERLLASSELRYIFGRKAQRRVSGCFNAENLIHEHIKLYRSLLKL